MADDEAAAWHHVRLTVRGRVQGVSYRAWTQAEAAARGLSGWVRNRANGDVEALIAGPPEHVQILCELARSGPPMARVEQVLVEPVEASLLNTGDAGEGRFVILASL